MVFLSNFLEKENWPCSSSWVKSQIKPVSFEKEMLEENNLVRSATCQRYVKRGLTEITFLEEMR